MAKSKKRPAPAPTPADPLGPGLTELQAGDWVGARKAFGAVAEDGSLAEADRGTAKQLVEATRIDMTTVLVGLACLGLYAVAVTVTAFIQP